MKRYISRQSLSSPKRPKLNDAHSLHHNAPAFLHQLDSSLEGAPRSEEVVDDDHAHPLLDAALLDVDRVGAVLLAVGDSRYLAGELPGLAEGDEGDLEGNGEGDAKVVPAGFESGDGVDLVLFAAVALDEDVNHFG